MHKEILNNDNIFNMQKLTTLIFLFLLGAGYSNSVMGQSLPVGTPALEEDYRNAQLIGEIDSSLSLCARPLFPSLIVKKAGLFNPPRSGMKEQAKDKLGVIRLMPFVWKQQFNSDHPEGLNDGAMIPARGYQTLVSGGVYAQLGWLSIQLNPEFVYAENKSYPGFSDEQPDAVWSNYYKYYLNQIDLPERFGESAYKKIFWGQSSIRITRGALSIGVSNENLWWGPGIQNALLMTNSAPGFKHITFNTVKPIRSIIGSFEGQLIAGRLEASGYPNIDPKRLLLHKVTYTAKPDDWRYINGLVLSYQPKWVPGLFLGVTRSFIIYEKDLGKGIGDYLPVITPVLKKAAGDRSEDVKKRDQLASVFMRWIATESHQEIYFEYGHEDHAYNSRDLMQDPTHTSAYLLGFKKLIPLKKHKNEFISFSMELTQLEKKHTSRDAGGDIWYVHTQVRDGYTNNGQLLGAGIGPGSNMQSLNISWLNGFKKLGLEIKRVANNNDFNIEYIKDYRSHWVDVGGALVGEWNYKKLIFNARFDVVSSMNYEHLYKPIPSTPPFWWDKGKDRINVHCELGVTYRF